MVHTLTIVASVTPTITPRSTQLAVLAINAA